MALWNFQKLEGESVPSSSPAAKGPSTFVLELRDQAGKPLLNLEEVGAQEKDRLKVRTGEGKSAVTALIPRAPFRQWQEEMHRLTVTARKPRRRVGAARPARIEPRFRPVRLV